MIGTVIGNYRIEGELGKGGMGVVYRAEHVTLGRPVALKMLQPALSNDAAMVQRFFNEARASSAIDHPGIVEIFDFGTHTDGRAFIVMALLQGESLEHRLRREGPLPPLAGATLLAQATSALAAAHARGIVHRDLKPDNIFLVPHELMPDGVQVKLLDFGIAKLANDQSTFKTQTGALMGTPAYMSPEQCMGKSDLDHRTDLYSLGCILFHVLTGRPPFTTEHGTGMLIAAHMRDEAPDVRSLAPHVPDGLAAITRRLLEKDPAARFQTALDLRAALVAQGAHAPTQPGRMVPVTSGSGALGPGSDRYRGDAAYDKTTAPQSAPPPVTTTSGAASQLVHAQPVKPRSKAPALIGVGLLLAAIAGVGIFVATSREEAKPATTTTTATPPPALPPPVAPLPEITPSEVTTPPAPDACPDGQTRSADTAGHCCWPEQAWSTAKNRCLGAPRCPGGTVKKGEACVAEAKPILVPKPSGTTFALGATTFLPDAPVVFRFGGRVVQQDTNRWWVAISKRGTGPSSYVVWKFVDANATTMTLAAPRQPGTYEARLYTNYPKESYGLAHAIPIAVEVPAEAPEDPDADGITPVSGQRFAAPPRATSGAQIPITFPEPMIAKKGERFWVAIVAADAADNTWGTWAYVPAKARSMDLTAPAAGAYEVRLHANYPAKSTNVVFRKRITIE